MKIAVGTQSQSKLEILQGAIRSIGIDDLELIPTDVDSGITYQPLDEKTTVRGSTNRAKNAIKAHPGTAIGLGLEGGLEEVQDGLYYLVCAATITTNKGATYVGISGKVALPKEVSAAIKDGEQFGDVIRQYQQEHKSDELVVALTERLINRKHDFTEAITNAFQAYQNSSHY